MKAVVVLLATTVVFVYGVPRPNLQYIIKQVKCLHDEIQNTGKFELVFVKDLKKNKTDNCEAKFFCQAEKVLSEVKFHTEAQTCIVDHDKLLRNLRQYNNGMKCSVPTKGDEIILRSFLDDLLTCAKKVFAGNVPNRTMHSN